MGFKVCSTTITEGGEYVRAGDVVDDTSDLVTRFASNFSNADDMTIGTSEAVSVKGMYLTSVVAVTVPAITDPDIASVDVDISDDGGLTFAAAVGDDVRAIPQEAMETAARIQNAYVIDADSIRVVFGSLGGNVTGGAKNFKFLITDLT